MPHQRFDGIIGYFEPTILAAYLRAERRGKSNGRVYTITIRAIDAAGNTTFASANVVVPKSEAAKAR